MVLQTKNVRKKINPAGNMPIEQFHWHISIGDSGLSSNIFQTLWNIPIELFHLYYHQ